MHMISYGLISHEDLGTKEFGTYMVVHKCLHTANNDHINENNVFIPHAGRTE